MYHYEHFLLPAAAVVAAVAVVVVPMGWGSDLTIMTVNSSRRTYLASHAEATDARLAVNVVAAVAAVAVVAIEAVAVVAVGEHGHVQELVVPENDEHEVRSDV